MTEITDIQDARAMKRMGAPLNTPVEHREFDLAISKHWINLKNAENGFDHALVEYAKGPRAGSVGKFNLMKRRNEALYKVAADAHKFAEHYEKDPIQQRIIFELIARALYVVEWWREAFAAAEAGDDGVNIDLRDAPRVFDLDD